jgi:hypothetical protein
MAGPVPKTRPDDKRGAKPGTASIPGGRGGLIGQAAHVPTRAQRRKVETLAALGLSQEAIGFACDLSVDTIKKYYRTELTNGLTNANARVGAAILNSAIGERDTCDTCKGTGGDDNAECEDCRGSGEAKSWRREPNTTAQIWWSKNRMGWTDRERIEHVGDGGGPVVMEQRSSGSLIKARLAEITKRSATALPSPSDSPSE